MNIRSFRHKGLQRLYEEDSSRGVPQASLDKLTKILAVLDALRDEEQLRSLPSWKAHQLTGNRRGAWSLSVTRNWRMTFWIDPDEPAICDLDLEDYH